MVSRPFARVFRKKRIAFILFLSTAVFLVLLHTGPVQRGIFNQVSSIILEKTEFHVRADHVSWNLFTLNLDFKGICVDGPGVKVKIANLAIRLSPRIMTGALAFKDVLVADGSVLINPDELPKSKTDQPSDFSIPEIMIQRVQVSKIQFGLVDSFTDKQAASFKATHLSLSYKNEQLKTNCHLAIPELASLTWSPDIELSLSCLMPQFLRFNDIELMCQNKNLNLQIQGTCNLLDQTSAMNIWMSSNSLTQPFSSGFMLEGSTRDLSSHVEICTHAILNNQEIPIAITLDATLHNLKETPHIEIPVSMAIGEWVESDMLIHIDSSHLKLYGIADAEPAQPDLFPNTIPISFSFNLPDYDLEQMTLEVASNSMTSFGFLTYDLFLDQDMSMTIQNELLGVAQISGQQILKTQTVMIHAATFPLSVLPLNPTINRIMEHQSMTSVQRVPELNSEFWLGDMALCGEIGLTEDNTIKLRSLNGFMEKAHFFDSPELNVEFEASGPLDKLSLSMAVNQDANVISLESTLDINGGTIESGSIDFSHFILKKDNWLVDLEGSGSISGVIEDPEMNLVTTVQIIDEGKNIARIFSQAHIKMSEVVLEIRLMTAPFELNGQGSAYFNEKDIGGYATFQGQTAHHKDLVNPIDLPLPDMQVLFSVDHVSGVGSSWVTNQVWSPVENISIPMSPTSPASGIEIGGITLSGPFFGIDQDEIFFDTRFELSHADDLFKLIDPTLSESVQCDQLTGSISAALPFSSLCPQVELKINPISGTCLDEPFQTNSFQITYDSDLHWTTAVIQYAGRETTLYSNDLDQSSSFPNLEISASGNDISLFFESKTVNQDIFTKFVQDKILIGVMEPSAVSAYYGKIDQLRGSISFDLNDPDPQISIETGPITIVLMSHTILADQLGLTLNTGLQLSGQGFSIDGHPAILKPIEDGFIFNVQIPVSFLQAFEPYLGGDAEFNVNVHYSNGNGSPIIQGSIIQTDGTLIYPEPWMEITSLGLDYYYQYGGDLNIQDGSMLVNGGIIDFSGSLPGLGKESDFRVLISQVPLTIMSSPATLSANLDLHSSGAKHALDGTIIIHDLLMSPVLTVKEALDFFEESYPMIHFPDPVKENVKLDISIRSEKNIVFDHDLAFIDMELPKLRILGSLAEPLFHEGTIHINEGSEIKIGRDTFVFNPSQIEFFPDREGDPYLQVTMEMGDYYNNNSIQMIGFMTELEHNLGTQGAASFLGSFLLGKMSNMLSLQGTSNSETLTDASFSLVVSQTLGDKIITRYILPLDQGGQKERYELSFGPYDNTMLSLVQEEDEISYDALKKFKWGKPDEHHQRLKKIKWTFSPEVNWKLKRKIKYRWSLPKTGTYSKLRTRSAQLGLERLLREEGFLDAVSLVEYLDKTLSIHVNSGKKYNLETNRIDLTNKEIREIFRKIPWEREKAAELLKLDLRQMVVNKGFFPGLFDLELSDHHVFIDFYPGTQIRGDDISLGEANGVCDVMLKDDDWRKEFLKTYLHSPRTAMDLLENILAAKGYLQPDLGRPHFSIDFKTLNIPVSLGPLAKLEALSFSIDGTIKEVKDLPWLSQYLGQPFNHKLIKHILQKAHKEIGSDYTVKIKPWKSGSNAMLKLQVHTLMRHLYEEADVKGNIRISKESVLRIIDLKGDAREEQLASATRRLIEAGQYKSVRFLTHGKKATFFLKERNRWDMDFGLSWTKTNSTRLRLQFKDRMFLCGHHDFMTKFEWTTKEKVAAAQLLFRNPFKWRGNLYFYSAWNRIYEGVSEESALGFGIIEFKTNLPELFKQTLEYQYPINEHHSLRLGTVIYLQRLHIHVEEYEEDFFDGSVGELFDTYSLINDQKLMPIEFSWLWKNIDHSILPKNGNLFSARASYYLDGFTDPDWVGPRLNVNHTLFHTWDTLTWQHRIKMGGYNPDGDISYSVSDESPFFFLGGGTNLRGYKFNTVGPYNELTEEGRGGEAIFFLSEQLDYDLNWYGLGISLFADSGQVWDHLRNVKMDELYYSTGVGVFIDSPIGYFRLDWVERLEHDGRPETENVWHFQFGKVF